MLSPEVLTSSICPTEVTELSIEPSAKLYLRVVDIVECYLRSRHGYGIVFR